MKKRVFKRMGEKELRMALRDMADRYEAVPAAEYGEKDGMYIRRISERQTHLAILMSCLRDHMRSLGYVVEDA